MDWQSVDAESPEIMKNTAATLAQSEPIQIGAEFRYARFFPEEDERVSAWLLTFYDRVVFLALTAPTGP